MSSKELENNRIMFLFILMYTGQYDISEVVYDTNQGVLNEVIFNSSHDSNSL